MIIHNNMLPGLLSEEVEFVAIAEGVVEFIHDKRVCPLAELPACKKAIILADMALNPEMVKALPGAEHATEDDLFVQYVYTYFGGLDRKADIEVNGKVNHSEYINHTSTVIARFDNGKEISPAQLHVLKHIDLPQVADIADKIHRSEMTIARHIGDMLRNSGFQNTKSLAIWAVKKGII